ncbi:MULTISPECIES: hypothetical protein [unclassified Mesorhizobium]|uniref:hypothetical protein n=1 Tax=unclassified Mesorhizobium TaxID=325217 RepID=UPI000F75C299|nr:MULTISPECIES: hypothetical protein [unclassified Mesorhizobium]AZO16605.1 hypothetical protein EJ069_18935 [Mesorhizobium sp. M2A.F.Ca.ET.043.05.1.1]RUX27942.1 hypothetical protein EOA23_16170 [Mesorhizobium sp. M2A.F.Ca.ET.042.01.1.1]RWE75141.1 MAG: hypothetical protein EOS42_15045 [Mesorhizobium sp.]TIV26028.1 MAG: hypothetical protein E5V90_24910 [Mesorhizobium sp.]TIW22002.1 MAG: hypothetical protein E5V81_11800 [Mesorhizobium sp.]
MARKVRETLRSEQELSETTTPERETTVALEALGSEEAPSRMLELARKLDAAIASHARKARPN